MSVYDAMEQQKEINELREKLALTENDRDEWSIKARDLKKENKCLKARNEELNENCYWLAKENETLKMWLDNKEKLNEEYRKQIDKLKQIDISCMEDDTIQELIDIGEI